MKSNFPTVGYGHVFARSGKSLRSGILLATALVLGNIASAQCSVDPITGTTSVCVSATTTLNCATPGGTWSSDNDFIASVDASGVVSGGWIAGTATISYGVSTGCGMVYSTTVVTVEEPAYILVGTTTSLSPANVCIGGNNTLSGNVPGGTWSSANSSIATVGSSTGIVTGVDGGTVNITYHAGNSCGSTPVVQNMLVEEPVIGGSEFAFCPGSNRSYYNVGTGIEATWSSSAPAVADFAFFSIGYLSAVSAGTATITLTTDFGCTATKVVTVDANPVVPPITGASSVCVGSSITLADSEEGGEWTSSNTGVTTVDLYTGEVTGVAAGTANITYFVAHECVTTPAVKTVTVNANSTPAAITGTATVCVGSTTSLSHSAPGGTWSSGNASVATVGSTGIVSGVAAGTATISYAIADVCGTVYATKTATVNAIPASISGIATVCVGGTLSLSSATGGGTWASSNGSVATIGTSGTLAATGAGTATISYTVSGCVRTASVNVSAAVAAITGTAAVCNGTGSTLACSTGSGTWSSSATGVATVGSGTGVVSSVSAGTTTISYRVNAGCISTRVYTVNVQPGTISGSSLVIGSTTLSCSPSGGTWSSSNTARATVNSSGVVTAVSSGSAVITYQFSTGCRSTKNISCLALRPGADAEENTIPQPVQVSVFPNPTHGAITVESPVAGTFSIYALDGRMVAQHTIDALHQAVSLPQGLAAATYLCRFIGNDGSVYTTRLVYEP
ncbi:hypothetical protein GCM10023093_18980 [Nemorincola caseinilytica]|uniref:BIG2 domain-containing protein n=1 Tax=Nemorincola caseinilytica TaxID=2054315 RepID=A0ABP8NHH2_9BACT